MKLKMFLVLLLIIGFCYAETDEKEMRKEGMERKEKMSSPPLHESIDADTIEALKVAKIKKELDLTPEQAGKFFENYYRVSDIRREYMEKKSTLINDVGGLLSKGEVDERVLEEKVKTYYKLEKEMQEKMREIQDKVVDGLSLKQRAKLIVFEKNFEKYVRNTFKEMLGRQKKEGKEFKCKKEMMPGQTRPEDQLPPPGMEIR